MRFWSLFVKEVRQLARNRRLIIMLILPPTVELIFLGYVLNPQRTKLRLGVLDQDRSAASRELVSAFGESRSFLPGGQFASAAELELAMQAGDVDAGLVIAYDFSRLRARGQTADVQLLVNAVNANTANIAAGYAEGVVAAYNLRAGPLRVAAQPAAAEVASQRVAAGVAAHVKVLYNPGLEYSWFIVTGIMGMLLFFDGLLVASTSIVREKELGTVELLLMTPASATEIILSKTLPLLIFQLVDLAIALAVGYAFFRIPVRGSFALLFLAGTLFLLTAIGTGVCLAVFSATQQQAQLLGFFVNPPVGLLSGTLTPIEAMPQWLQPLTYVNPLRHFATVARGVMLKGATLDVLYPSLLTLFGLALLLFGVSVWQFRKQLNDPGAGR